MLQAIFVSSFINPIGSSHGNMVQVGYTTRFGGLAISYLRLSPSVAKSLNHLLYIPERSICMETVK